MLRSSRLFGCSQSNSVYQQVPVEPLSKGLDWNLLQRSPRNHIELWLKRLKPLVDVGVGRTLLLNQIRPGMGVSADVPELFTLLDVYHGSLLIAWLNG